MTPLQKTVIRRGMAGLLVLSAVLARPGWLQGASLAWSRLLAAMAARRRHIGPATDLESLGRAWQAGFPSARQVPITAITDDTVFARIETPCPLRGSGKTTACWRMMEYDRAIAGRAGGQFIVLESQAEHGVTACRVALRWAGAAAKDLVPAHLRRPG